MPDSTIVYTANIGNFTYTIGAPGIYVITTTGTYTGSASSLTWKVYQNDTLLGNKASPYNITANIGDIITATASGYNTYSVTIEFTPVLTKTGIYLTPKFKENIGANSEVVLLDDKIGIISLGTSSGATTGNVVPGNYKGYIRILYRGEYIKIPYYGD